MVRARIQWVGLLSMAAVLLGGSVPAFADDPDPVGLTPTPEDAAGMTGKPSYSPYAGRDFPTQIFWGDTHLHTSFSADAGLVGATTTPDDAFRFAKGEEVISSNGIPARLQRPLSARTPARIRRYGRGVPGSRRTSRTPRRGQAPA